MNIIMDEDITVQEMNEFLEINHTDLDDALDGASGFDEEAIKELEKMIESGLKYFGDKMPKNEAKWLRSKLNEVKVMGTK